MSKNPFLTPDGNLVRFEPFFKNLPKTVTEFQTNQVIETKFSESVQFFVKKERDPRSSPFSDKPSEIYRYSMSSDFKPSIMRQSSNPYALINILDAILAHEKVVSFLEQQKKFEVTVKSQPTKVIEVDPTQYKDYVDELLSSSTGDNKKSFLPENIVAVVTYEKCKSKEAHYSYTYYLTRGFNMFNIDRCQITAKVEYEYLRAVASLVQRMWGYDSWFTKLFSPEELEQTPRLKDVFPREIGYSEKLLTISIESLMHDILSKKSFEANGRFFVLKGEDSYFEESITYFFFLRKLRKVSPHEVPPLKKMINLINFDRFDHENVISGMLFREFCDHDLEYVHKLLVELKDCFIDPTKFGINVVEEKIPRKFLKAQATSSGIYEDFIKK